MKQGGWVPLDKNLMYAFPKDREYSLIEAAFSYQLYLDKPEKDRQPMSLGDWSRIWGWSKTRIIRFLKDNLGTISNQPKYRKRTVKFRFILKLDDIKEQRTGEQERNKKRFDNANLKQKPKPKKIEAYNRKGESYAAN